MATPLITIGTSQIGPSHPCFIIAEAGVNHNGSLDMALKLVDMAVEAGADAVKFQKRNLKNLYPPELLNDPNSAEWAFQYILPILKSTELTTDEFRQIKAYCDQKGIRFMCTPWDEDSLAFLEELDLEAYKVASADLVNFPLLEKLIATGKPLILSTGMATEAEIEKTAVFLKDRNAQFALLHCVSTYPAPFDGLNLRFIETLKKHNVPVGYSSHERGIAMPLVALALGASIIEKHITLDRTLPGPDHPASLEPPGMNKMVRDIRHAEQALGVQAKSLSAMEKLNRQVLRKSLVAAHPIKAGTILKPHMVKVQGPGKGLSPQRIDELLGVKLKRDVKTDDYFIEDDLNNEQAETIQRQGLKRTWGLKARFHDLTEVLQKQPEIVELHFSEDDVDYNFSPPPTPYPYQLIVHAPEFANSKLLDLCSFDDQLWEQSIHLIQRTIDKTVSLHNHFKGTPTVVIHVGGMSMDEPLKDRDRLLNRAADAFRLIDSKGTILLPENLPPRPWYLGGQWIQNVFIRPEEMVAFAKEVGVGITLDISHAQLYCNDDKRNLCHFVEMVLPYTRHVHIADAMGIDGEGLQIGEGMVDWQGVLSVLSQGDFSWLPEIWSGHLNQGAGFVRAINRLNQYGIL